MNYTKPAILNILSGTAILPAKDALVQSYKTIYKTSKR